jgi:hypothetical protein
MENQNEDLIKVLIERNPQKAEQQTQQVKDQTFIFVNKFNDIYFFVFELVHQF